MKENNEYTSDYQKGYKQAALDFASPLLACEKDLRHLDVLMKDMVEEWNLFKEHSYFEKLGSEIIMVGMQTIGEVLDVINELKEETNE